MVNQPMASKSAAGKEEKSLAGKGRGEWEAKVDGTYREIRTISECTPQM
jgi:hypothetical protein